ncbi:MAG TPA: acyl-CoA dehydrogenase family protein [Acidimicrobiales bacterium]|nr:acyl-CoA dehydrogenase family protein [Acidimicrobiales bacterium]
MGLSREERQELRATARRLLGRTSPPERVREVVIQPAGHDRDLWAQMVALGWTSIHVDERHGGAGCGYADLAVVVHELGRALTPSPFLASAVLATGALSLAEHEALSAPLLASLVEGTSTGSVAFASEGGSYALDRLTTTWKPAAGSVRLDGVAGFVLDADLADVLVVAARRDDGTIAALAVDRATPGLRATRVPTVDETRRLFTVTFDGVTVGADRLLAEPGPRTELLLDRVLALGVVAAAGDAAGAAEQALESTAEYAKARVQFGRPIGSFQAVKHHCANMAIAVEASTAAVRGAADALDGDPAGWATAAAITASYVGPACAEACALELRVHGGIGFTWEHDTHLHLKRVKLDEVLFGSPSWHRRRLADAVFPSPVAS